MQRSEAQPQAEKAPAEVLWLEDSFASASSSSSFRGAPETPGLANGGNSSSGSLPGRSGLDASGERAPPEVLEAFNSASSGAKAVQRLVDFGILPASDGRAAVAAFLLANDGKLDASMVGDYLGGDDPVAAEAAGLVMDSLTFRGMPLDSALRKMISVIKLPGAHAATHCGCDRLCPPPYPTPPPFALKDGCACSCGKPSPPLPPLQLPDAHAATHCGCDRRGMAFTSSLSPNAFTNGCACGCGRPCNAAGKPASPAPSRPPLPPQLSRALSESQRIGRLWSVALPSGGNRPTPTHHRTTPCPLFPSHPPPLIFPLSPHPFSPDQASPSASAGWSSALPSGGTRPIRACSITSTPPRL
jgi:hypothetical protein